MNARLPSFKEYLLAELRCASLRAALAREDINAIGCALKNGIINADQALDVLADYQCFHFIEPVPPARALQSASRSGRA